MGSDAEQKNELDPYMLKYCDQYVPDNQSQTSVLGELHHALKKNLISSQEKFMFFLKNSSLFKISLLFFGTDFLFSFGIEITPLFAKILVAYAN